MKTSSVFVYTVIMMSVLPENDGGPVFVAPNSDSSTKINVTENIGFGSSVYQCEATDFDNSTLAYTFLSQHDIFNISKTGEITVTGNIDYESIRQYTLTIRVSSATASSDTVLNVDLVDVDEVPEITNLQADGSSEVLVPEDSRSGKPVFRVVATDPEGRKLSYRITDPQAYFTVNMAGLIQVDQQLDFEVQNVHSIVISVSDGYNAETRTLTVKVTDVNEKPIFKNLDSDPITTTVIAEDSPTGFLVYNLDVLDPERDNLTFALVTPVSLFEVTSQSEVLVGGGDIDFETRSYYSLALRVSDGVNTVTGFLNVEVTDVNEPPTFVNIASDGSTAIGVKESQETGTVVFVVLTSDPENDIVTITLLSTNTPFGESQNQILLNGDLDFELKPSFTLNLRMSDGVNDVDGVLKVNVIDVDEPPTFTHRDNVSITVEENVSPGTSVFTVTAEDPENQPVTYTLVEGSGMFSISDSVVLVQGELDAEKASLHIIRITASDGLHQSQCILYIHVTDINEAPQFSNIDSNGITSIRILETTEIGVPVYTISVTDPDETKLTLTLVKPVSEFIIKDAHLVTNGSFDYETTASYSLQIRASDGTLSTDLNLQVYIVDENDEVPVITGTAKASIKEGMPKGSTIPFQLSVNDADNDDLLYYSLSGSHALYFEIDETTGVVTTTQVLDADAKDAVVNFDSLTMTVTDSGGHSAKTSVIVLLIDINDNSPRCSKEDYTAAISENSPVGTSIVSLHCSDADWTSPNNNLTPLVLDGDDPSPNTKFQLSGQLIVTSLVALDFEVTRSYTLLIQIVDNGTEPRTGSATVHITVLPVNEFPPGWTSFAPPYSTENPYRISENSPVGTSVVAVGAEDADDGETLRYSIVNITSGSDETSNEAFSIDPITGVVFTTKLLDNTLASSYIINVKATDQGLPKAFSTVRAITVNIEDYNKHAPAFNKSFYSVSISETDVPGTSVVNLSATDMDSTATMTYAIIEGNKEKFYIEDSEIKLKATIDLDSTQNDLDFYLLTVGVTDGGTPELSGTATVGISVTTVNEHGPAFTSDMSPSVMISEDISPGTVVVNVTAFDLDRGEDERLSFSLAEKSSPGIFQIDRDTGSIILTGVLDYEDRKEYILEVTVEDNGSPKRFAVTTQSVSVANVNDNRPKCGTSARLISIPENTNVGTEVVDLQCSDADITDVLEYSILSGNTDNKFTVDSGGVILLVNPIDYELDTRSYQLHTNVSDGLHFIGVKLNINVDPVNEVVPVFESEFAVSVSEADPPGTLGVFLATDSDAPPQGVSVYAIAAVTNGGSSLFHIDPRTGNVMLVSHLDYELLPKDEKFYLLTVTATDGGGLVGTGTMTVYVNDTNDNAPVCAQSIWTVHVDEDVDVPRTVIDNLGCSDKEDASMLTYTLYQNPGDKFTVVNGTVTLTAAVDYEESAEHSLVVTVSDTGAPIQSTAVTVNIIIDNVNDGPPEFQRTFSCSVPEDIKHGSSVSDIVATDPDGVNKFGNPIYSIIGGNPENQFSIDHRTGRIFVQSRLDREVSELHEIIVQAKEEGDSGVATATLTVTVTDVNDNQPICFPGVTVTTLKESEPTDSVVISLNCTDSDLNQTLMYQVTSGDLSKFIMEGRNIKLATPLDFDSGDSKYDLRVEVSDGVHDTVFNGVVLVEGVNEFPPVWSKDIYTVSQSESLPAGSKVAAVVATDADSAATQDGQVSYTFVTSYSQFDIDSTSGAITLVSALDRETSATHDLLVTATDGATIVTATVSVTVTDENDNAPVFNSSLFRCTVLESDLVSAVITSVTAEDSDDPEMDENGKITYSIIGGDPTNNFRIDDITGDVMIYKRLDYESTMSYSIIINAVDRAGDQNSKSGTTTLIIIVTDVNEHDPVFTSTVVNLTIPEATEIGTSIYSVSATDDDAGDDALMYTMVLDAMFNLDEAGVLKVKGRLDFEVQSSYIFTVTASDEGTPVRTADVIVNIAITDVNDNYPSCTAVAPASYREDATGTVASLSCSDPDSGASGTLYYAIVSVNGVAGTGPFAISGSGVVTIATNLDYETDTIHSLIIRVEDGGVPALSTTVTVNIAVSDLNEAAPAFSGTPFNPSFSESESIGYTVLTVAATDADTADTIAYSLSDTTNLQMGPSSGVITLKLKQDREFSASFSLNVCATDSRTVTAVKQTCETLTVTITDANDNLPVFSPALYTGSVDENEAVGQTVTTVTATDADADLFGTVAYSIVVGNAGNVFRVDAAAGHIVVDNNVNLDYETITQFTLTVRATDGGGQTTNVSVPISVNPINEITPTFTPASSTENVPENSAVGFVVIDLNAVDSDSGADGSVSYSILSGAGGKFAVDPATGEVKVSNVLNAEAVASYVITIQATDASTNSSALSGTYILTATVTDINDETPSCTSSYYSTSISESATPATSVKQLICSDADASTPNNALSYSKTGGDPGNLFDVESSSGLLTVAAGASFDREMTESFLLDIAVTDAGSPSLEAVVKIFIKISDENDNYPSFGHDLFRIDVPEDSSLGSVVSTLKATDADFGLNGAIRYSIASGNNNGHFALDSSSGDLTVQDYLDRETLSSYNLLIVASDLGTPTSFTGTTTVSVTVTDVNDNCPQCLNSVYVTSVSEEAIPGTSLLTLNCTDQDYSESNYFEYSIINGNKGDVFAIDPISGSLTVSSSLDAEIENWYRITVGAFDGICESNVITLVTVLDINEHAPTLSPPGPYSLTISEDKLPGTKVVTINATDLDTTNNVLRYSIKAGNEGNQFWIHDTTGEVFLHKSLSKEVTDSYALMIEVSDGNAAGSLTSETEVIINIGDVNDNPPNCSQSVYTSAIPEDSESGTIIGKVSCSDPDEVTPVLRYDIIRGDNGKFTIDSSSGVLKAADRFDYENKKVYNLQIEVSDQGVPPKTTVVTFRVDVLPVNEHTPEFVALKPIQIQENVAVGTSIYQVLAKDDDQDDRVLGFSITDGNKLGIFTIHETLGVVRTTGELDRETISEYSLTMRVSDDIEGSPSEKFAEAKLKVTILDVNDNKPIFSPSVYKTDIMESATVGATVLEVNSLDDDLLSDSEPFFSILSGNTENTFSFTSNNLILNKELDFETLSWYELQVQVNDTGEPPLVSNGNIFITVLPVNEFPPKPTKLNDKISISESSSVGMLLYHAKATDKDSGPDGLFSWNITNGNADSVFLCTSSGELYISSVLDYDKEPRTYNLTLQASDWGGLSNYFWLEIQLEDENDEHPQFTKAVYSPVIPETDEIGLSVMTLSVSDKDSGSNGEISFSIISGNGEDYLSVNSISGKITTSQPIDRERHEEMFLVVEAKDRGDPVLSSTAVVKLMISDVNDNVPKFSTDNLTLHVAEDIPFATVIFRIDATDLDSEMNNRDITIFTSRYGSFWVNAGGDVLTMTTLDRELIPSYDVVVFARDKGKPALTSSMTLSVVIDDVNDNSPEIHETYSASLNEDVSVGTVVFRINATDPDIGINADLEYSLVTNGTSKDFKIDHLSGIVQVANALDHESVSLYEPVILITDQGNPNRTTTTTVTVAVEDVNDNRPLFEAKEYQFSISENVPVSSIIGEIHATDNDSSTNAALSYEIAVVFEGERSDVTISRNSGEIRTAGPVDREKVSSYRFLGRAKDGGVPRLFSDVLVTIVVEDQNDNLPVFNNEQYNVSVEENTAVGSSILALTVTDADETSQNLSIYTDPEGGRAERFLSVDSKTGIVRIKANIDREIDEELMLRVYATDNSTAGNTATATVNVFVLDLNDNAPKFTKPFYNTEIDYSLSCGNVIVTLSANDPDLDEKGQISYEFWENNHGFLFALDGKSGALALQLVTPSGMSYSSRIAATDKGSPQRMSEPVTLRVDTFDPNVVVVVVSLGVDRETFLYKQDAFLMAIQSVLSSTYPTCMVRVWCVEDRSDQTPETGSRRRLLAVSPVDVKIVVIADNTTESGRNLDQEKRFLSSSEVVGFLASDFSGTPAGSLQGKPLDYFAVQKVVSYFQPVTLWYQTAVGIVFMTLAAILLVIFIAVTVVAIATYRKRRNRNMQKVQPKNQMWLPATKPLLAAKDPVSKTAGVTKVNGIDTSSMPVKDQLQSARVWTTEHSDVDSISLPRTPVSHFPTPKPGKTDHIVINRQFDGKAVDPASGKVYEYNTRTNERRWLTTPNGGAVVAKTRLT